MFMDDRTVAQIAPSGNFGNTFSINCGAPGAPTVNAPGVGNPLLSAQQRALLCDAENLLTRSRRPATAVDQQSPARRRRCSSIRPPACPIPAASRRSCAATSKAAAAATTSSTPTTASSPACAASSATAWSYDMYYQFAQTNFAETYPNDFSVTRLGRALDVIDNPSDAGRRSDLPLGRSTAPIRAASPTTSSRTGQVSPAALAYLQTPGFQRGTNQQTVANASLTGNLGDWGMQFPWASDGVGIALRRRVSQGIARAARPTPPSRRCRRRSRRPGRADARRSPARSTSARPSPRSASRSSRTASSTISSLEAGYRYSDYGIGDRSFSTDTYKIGARSSHRSATSASAAATTARSARRTSRSCSRRSASRSTATPIRAPGRRRRPAPLAACQAHGRHRRPVRHHRRQPGRPV